MYKILICSIFRNQEHNIKYWYRNVSKLIQIDKQNEYTLSIYQNDSTDRTFELLSNLDFGETEVHLHHQNINSQFFDRHNTECSMGKQQCNSNKNLIKRLVNLSTARNKSLEQLHHKQYDYVLFIQSDVKYNVIDMFKFLKKYYPEKCDIVSPVSIKDNTVYDSWATRFNKKDDWFNFRKYTNNTVMKLYSTFNCFCLYNSQPFYQGVEFDYRNKNGDIDCDTVNICQSFRMNGFRNIILDSNFKVQGS